jgi:hypothetical protein
VSSAKRRMHTTSFPSWTVFCVVWCLIAFLIFCPPSVTNMLIDCLYVIISGIVLSSLCLEDTSPTPSTMSSLLATPGAASYCYTGALEHSYMALLSAPYLPLYPGVSPVLFGAWFYSSTYMKIYLYLCMYEIPPFFSCLWLVIWLHLEFWVENHSLHNCEELTQQYSCWEERAHLESLSLFF